MRTYRHAVTALIVLILAVTSMIGFAPKDEAQATTIRISSSKEASMVRLTNAARAKHHLKGYRVNAELVKVARAHALRMARENRLYHNPRLPHQITSYRVLGENVGYSPTLTTVQRAFMKSPSHRANILHSRYTQVGIGVAVVGDRIWVTEVFRKP